MIFATVGTHEQPFDRLVMCLDEIKKEEKVTEEVIIQIGFSTYIPAFCKWQKMFSYQEMCRYIEKAHIVITHGGPSSFIMPLQVGKIPIVVPRQKQYGEHVNDHQLEFSTRIAETKGNIIVVENIAELEQTITNYDDIIKKMIVETSSNNARFCKEIELIVDNLFKTHGN